jgi:hypothetical protein
VSISCEPEPSLLDIRRLDFRLRASGPPLHEADGSGAKTPEFQIRLSPRKTTQNACARGQDNRRIKHRIRATVGLKNFSAAGVTIGGVELTEKIGKGQFKTDKLGGSRATIPRSGELRWLHNSR